MIPLRGGSAQGCSCDFFHLREGGFVFEEGMPVFFVEFKNIEERGEQSLKILAIGLLGGHACLERGAGLRD